MLPLRATIVLALTLALTTTATRSESGNDDVHLINSNNLDTRDMGNDMGRGFVKVRRGATPAESTTTEHENQLLKREDCALCKSIHVCEQGFPGEASIRCEESCLVRKCFDSCKGRYQWDESRKKEIQIHLTDKAKHDLCASYGT